MNIFCWYKTCNVVKLIYMIFLLSNMCVKGNAILVGDSLITSATGTLEVS